MPADTLGAIAASTTLSGTRSNSESESACESESTSTVTTFRCFLRSFGLGVFGRGDSITGAIQGEAATGRDAGSDSCGGDLGLCVSRGARLANCFPAQD